MDLLLAYPIQLEKSALEVIVLVLNHLIGLLVLTHLLPQLLFFQPQLVYLILHFSHLLDRFLVQHHHLFLQIQRLYVVFLYFLGLIYQIFKLVDKFPILILCLLSINKILYHIPR